jgi:peptidoglycan/LPS O-acetylase OafA/YrhL
MTPLAAAPPSHRAVGDATPRRLSSLDGLRGVAAVVVVLHHVLLVVPLLAFAGAPGHEQTSFRWLSHSPLHLLWAGEEAVVVFFVLSGCVLTLAVLRASPTPWRAYYPSRLVRLYLPVVASVGFALTLALTVPRSAPDQRSRWMNMHDDEVSVLSVIRTATLLGNADTLNSVLWTLRWEVVFSLALPLYVWIARRVVRSGLVLAALTIAASVVGSLSNSTPLTYLPIFMLGVVLAVHLGRVQSVVDRLRHRWPWALPALGALSLLLVTTRWWWPWQGPTGDPVLSTRPTVLAACTLVVALALVTRWSWLESPAVAWLGRVSFSLYLVHEPVVVSVAYLLPTESAWLVGPIAVPLSVAAAALFFRVVEAPSHRAARAVARWCRGSRAQPERAVEASVTAARVER